MIKDGCQSLNIINQFYILFEHFVIDPRGFFHPSLQVNNKAKHPGPPPPPNTPSPPKKNNQKTPRNQEKAENDNKTKNETNI